MSTLDLPEQYEYSHLDSVTIMLESQRILQDKLVEN